MTTPADFKPDFSPGLYQHYKGNFYRLLMLARLSEARDIEVVLYLPLSHNPASSYPRGQPWVRPLNKPLLEGDDLWCDRVEWPDGTWKQRFTRIGD